MSKLVPSLPTWCSVQTSTAAQENAISLSTCSGELKGMIVSVAVTERLSIDQTKALLDKVMGRLR